MKKILVMVILASLLLSGCSLFRTGETNQQVSDADMATRVAELLATMTTPTLEEFFPDTPTAPVATEFSLPSSVGTATEETPVVVLSVVPTAEVSPTATLEPTTAATSTPEEPTATPTATATATANLTDPANRLGNPSGSDPMDNRDTWSWPNRR